MNNSYQYFQNSECQFFPCHNVEVKDGFNCLFCYCPLYNHKNCGGNFKTLGNGVKDCSQCLLPHAPENYKYIINKLINQGSGS